MEARSIARARIGIRRVAEPGLSNSYRTQASKASVMSIARQGRPRVAVQRGKLQFLRNKNRFRESYRLNTFGLERVYRQISPHGARAKNPDALRALVGEVSYN
jgi:hypothetical protein